MSKHTTSGTPNQPAGTHPEAHRPEQSFFKKNWKLILNIVTALALVGLVVALRDQVSSVLKNLGQVQVWALLLLIPLEFINYDAQAQLYRRLFAILGNKLSYKDMFKLSLELNFVNSVFPSGGVSGISYFGVRMRSHEVTGARATLVQLMKIVLLFISFEVLILVGVVALAIGGKATGIVVLLAGSLTTLMVLGTLAFVYIIGSKRRINAFFTFATQVINKTIQVVRPKHPETINIAKARNTFDDMHSNYELFRTHYKELRSPFAYALVANMAEVMAVYVVYIAFGEWVNLGAIILAYAIANFAGFISVLPGGIGVYEALMTGVLVIAGVPAALSIPVVVMYRVLNTAIQLPPGFYFYHKALKTKVGTAAN